MLEKLIDKLSILTHLYMESYQIHYLIYLFALLISTVHTWITILNPNDNILLAIKWFNPCIYFDNTIVLILCSSLCICTLLILCWQIKKTFRKNIVFQIEHTIELIIRKIGGILGFLLITIFMLPLVQSSITLIMKSQSLAFTIIAWITFITFSSIILPLYTLIFFNIIPLSDKINSNLKYINFSRVFIIFRFIYCVLYSVYSSCNWIIVGTMFILSLLIIFKNPILFYRHDTKMRLILYASLWYSYLRVIIQIQTIQIFLHFSIAGLPLFVIFLYYLIEIRIKYLTQNIQLILFYLRKPKLNKNSIILYFLHHKDNCQNIQCNCQNISEIQNIYQQPQQSFEIILDIIKYKYRNNKLTQQKTKQQKFKLILQIVAIQCQILSTQFSKWNQSLYIIESIQNQLKQRQQYAYDFHVYKYHFLSGMESITRTKFKTQSLQNSNQYAFEYYKFQNKVQQVNQKIKQSTINVLNFWKQLNSSETNYQVALEYIEKFYQQHCILQYKYQQIYQLYPKINLIYLSKIYQYYHKQISNNNIQIRIQKQPEAPVAQNTKYFKVSSHTATCLISISNNNNFGKIKYNNQYFWQLTSLNYIQNLNLNNLLPQCFIAKHTELMNTFIIDNIYTIYLRKSYIFLENKYAVPIYLMLQMIPSITDGLNACIYLCERQDKGVLVLNQNNQIIGYSFVFYQKICKNSRISDFKQNLTKQLFNQLINGQQVGIQFQSHKWKISLQHKIQINQQNYIYFCQVILSYQAIYLSFLNLQNQDKQISQDQLNSQKYNNFLQSLQSENKDKQQSFSSSNSQKQQKLSNELVVKLNKIINACRNCILLKIWTIATIIIIVAIIALCVLITLQAEKKIQTYKVKSQNRVRLIQQMSSIDNILYYIRKCNIQSQINNDITKFNLYVKNSQIINEQLTFNFRKLNFNDHSNNMIPLITVMPNGKIQQTLNNFIFTLQHAVLIPLVNLTGNNIQQLNFSITWKQVYPPYNYIQVNYLTVYLNSFYSIFPNQKNIIKQIFNTQFYQIQIKNNIILYGLISLGLILLLILILFFIYLRIILVNYLGYQILQNLSNNQLFQRLKICKKYYRQHIQRKQLKLQQEQFKVNIKTMTNLNKNRNKSIKSVKQIKSRNSLLGIKQQQAINFALNYPLQTVQTQFHSDDNPQKKDKIKIVKRKIKFIRQYLIIKLIKYFLILIPIISYLIFIICYQVYFDILMSGYTKGQYLLSQRNHFIKQIKLYALQIGLHQGALQSNLPNSIVDRMDILFDDIYDIERQIIAQLIEKKINPKLEDMLRSFNNQNVCQNIKQINMTKNLLYQDYILQQKCESIFGKAYFTNGMRSAIIVYIQLARKLWSQYKGCQNCSFTKRVEFLLLEQHKIFQGLDYYFESIIGQQLKLITKQFNESLITYTRYQTIGTIITFLFTILIMYHLLIKQKQYLIQKITRIQAIFHVITYQSISSNQKLLDIIQKDQSYQWLIQ